MNLLATTLPEHTNDGYVAAAYIVFFAIVLIYVTIMAVRLSRVERKIEMLRSEATEPGDAREGKQSGGTSDGTSDSGTREHTLKGAGETV